MRWSLVSVRCMRCPATTWPSRTTGASRTAPTASTPACGGVITAVKLRTPYMPRFDTVKVALESSGERIEPSRHARELAHLHRALPARGVRALDIRLDDLAARPRALDLRERDALLLGHPPGHRRGLGIAGVRRRTRGMLAVAGLILLGLLF